MGKWCAICETCVEKCEKPEWHGTGKEMQAVRQEVVFGKWEEERRVDLEKGREVGEFKWRGEMMEAGEEREKYRAHGREIAVKRAEAREEKIGKMKCDVCFVARKECVWPEVHFSSKAQWVAFCNEVKYVMHLERCKADEAQGRGSVEWRIGTRLAVDDVEGRERARVHGVECAARDAERYEARCLLEPAEEAERAERAARNAAWMEKRAAELRLEREAAVPGRIERGELVEAKFWPLGKARWAAVDEKTEARQFWERNVGCEAWGGKLWVDKKQVWEAGVAGLEPGPGVGGVKGGGVGAAGGGWTWAVKTREEAEFEKDVGELAEKLTGMTGKFSRMAWEAGDGGDKGRQAVVWMRGKVEAGRCYTVRQLGKKAVVMRVVEETGADSEVVEVKYVKGGVEQTAWMKKSKVLAGIESGTWKLTAVGGVGVEIEQRSEGAARGLVENVSAGALESMVAGSRVVPAKRAHGGA